MLGKIWFGMMAIGAGWALLSGDTGAFLRAAVSAGEASLSYGLKLAGILGFWLGVMEVAGRSGLVNRLARFTSPLIRWLFPSVPSEDPAASYILLNLTANLLGMGNAATPFGLKAMEELSRLNGGLSDSDSHYCTWTATGFWLPKAGRFFAGYGADRLNRHNRGSDCGPPLPRGGPIPWLSC